MSMKTEMPVLARHEGKWQGEYIHIDANANIVDRHASLLTCRFPDNEEHPYYQTNEYTWADGRKEVIQFPATYEDGKIYFNTERIDGYAWEVDELTVLLKWTYRHDPANYLYEMIQISPDGNHRARTWRWYESGELIKRTVIKEKRVA